MPSLADYSSQKPIKMLSIGNSGCGKTGALASLAKAGFKLRILDYDNGVGILASILKGDPALANVAYESCLDNFQPVGNKILPVGFPSAFTKGLNLLTNWKGGKDATAFDLGKPSTWGRESILVIDSLSHMSNAALIYILAMNNRSGDHPYQSDWGEAMDKIESVLKILYSDAIKCNVIVNAHITRVGEKYDDDGKLIDPGTQQPFSLGQKLPPKIPQYFNTMLHFDTLPGGKRIIRTKPSGDLGVKSEILGLPDTLPIESGLATFFKAANISPTSTKP